MEGKIEAEEREKRETCCIKKGGSIGADLTEREEREREESLRILLFQSKFVNDCQSFLGLLLILPENEHDHDMYQTCFKLLTTNFLRF